MKKIRNILSIALVFVMLIGFAPVNVFANNANAPTEQGADVAGQDYKTEAVNKINALNNLTDKDKAPFIEKVNSSDVTTKKAVDEIVADATKKDEEKAKEKAKEKELAEAKEAAKEELAKLGLEGEEKKKAEKAIDDATTPKAVKAVVTEAKTKNDAPAPATYTVNVYTNGYGTAEVTPRSASKGTPITVKAYPDSGYIVDSIVVRDQYNNVLDLRNFEYKNYYNNYPFWYDRFGYKNSYRYNFYDYRSWCYDTDRTVRSYKNYKTWCRLNNYTIDEDDYDDFIYWYDRYDDDDYYNWRYDRSYTYYDKADFTMPESNVTVTVTFTSAPYWRGGYYYDSRTGTYRRYYDDDYYYYRYRKNKKSNYYERQAKAEEEEKDKAEEEKKAPVLKSESRAVITIGSTILNKADMSGQSILNMDVAAYVKDGRTMLPIRYVAEALGLQVSWIKETRTVLIWDGINRIEIPVDTNKMIVNSVPYINDVKPEMKNGRTMLAVANIARMLGLQDGQDITWDAGKQQVTFVRKIYSK